MPRRASLLAAPWLSLVAVYLIWSSTYLALRYAVQVIPLLLASGSRYFAAGAMMFLVARLAGQRTPTRAEWRAALPTGALLCVVGNGFVAIAERSVSSGLAAMACAAMPIFACLFEAVRGQRPTRGEVAGIVLGFSGVVVLCAGDLRAQPLAAVLLVLAPMGWALGSILTRRLPRAPGSMHAAAQLLCGGACNLALGFALGQRLPAVIAPRALAALAYLAVFGSMIAFNAYSHLLATTRVAVATSYAYVNPVLAVLLGVLVHDGRIGASAVVAGVLVVTGVALAVRSGR